MNNDEYLTPNPHDIYRAPRGGIALLYKLGILKINETNAMIDALHHLGAIGESQALEIQGLARKIAAETIQLN